MPQHEKRKHKTHHGVHFSVHALARQTPCRGIMRAPLEECSESLQKGNSDKVKSSE
jgi:hypothetical protein